MDINADVTLDIQAPTTALSGDLTVSGNDISFGNSETISNASDNVIAITSASTTLSGDLTVSGNDIIFGNGRRFQMRKMEIFFLPLELLMVLLY